MLTQEALDRASGWCYRQGWRSLWSLGCQGPGGGPSAGVGILSRSWMGLHEPPSDLALSGPRALTAVAHPPGGQHYLLGTVYLHDCEGLSERNLDLLGAVGSKLDISGMPFILGGDFNFEPSVLLASEFPQNLKAQVVSTSECTCYPSNSAPKKFDFLWSPRGSPKPSAQSG